MTSGRCAACKYLRRRCPSDCIFSPYFPSNNPQRFACVHRIYGASNVGKMLQKVSVHLRAQAADTLHYEAQCRIDNPVYGCVGTITLLHEQLSNAQMELATAQANIAFLRHSYESLGGQFTTPYHNQLQQQHFGVEAEETDLVDFPEQNYMANVSEFIGPSSSHWFC